MFALADDSIGRNLTHFFDDELRLDWPKLPVGSCPITVRIDVGGRVSLDCFRIIYDISAVSIEILKVWRAAWPADVEDLGVLEFVMGTCTVSQCKKIARTLWPQLVHMLGFALDAKLHEVGSGQHSVVSLELQGVKWGDDVDLRRAMFGPLVSSAVPARH